MAERQRLTDEAKKAKLLANEFKKDPNDPCAHKFGDLELNRSQSNPDDRYAKVYTAVKNIDESLMGQDILVRGRLHTSRAQGKTMIFIEVREQFATVQAGLFGGETVSANMIAYAKQIPKESIIEIKAKVQVPEKEIHSCS